MTKNRGVSRLPPSFKTAGNGNVLSVTTESLARASALLHGTTAEDQATQTESTATLSSDSRVQPMTMFQTAGRGSVISVSNDSLARAKSLLQEAAATNEKEDEKMPPAGRAILIG